MAHQPVALIVDEASLERRFTNRGPAIQPGTVLVVADADGRAFQLDRRPSWTECVSGRFRTQFVVNTTDHTSILQESLPSRDDVFRFQASIDIGWRVTDAREVVVRGVRDGLAVARSYLLDLLMPITRGFDQDLPEQAENALNTRLRGHPVVLAEGITLYRVSARISREQSNQEWLRYQVHKDWERQRGLDQFADESASAHQRNALASIEQRGELRRVDERLAVLRATLPNVDDLTLRHLAHHPHDTGSLLSAIGQRHSEDRAFQLQIFEQFIAAGLIERAAVQGILSGAGIQTGPVGPALQPPYAAPRAALPGSVTPTALPAGAPQPPPPPYDQPPDGQPWRQATSGTPSAPPPATWDEETAPANGGGTNVVGTRRVSRPDIEPSRVADSATASGAAVPAHDAPYGEEQFAEPPLAADSQVIDGQAGAHVVGWQPRRRPQP
ncbi:hypothetical protein MXD61_14955 [Frankia sp. AgPm24]|uniref:hypothetical protein n=1 Tax=Frankia sp. AgPm24 TaxID=631128 RepID=UPI00200E71A7|nr:hypothetical protein [Frankia sp. AgPm24]MCK9923153.1 hypothetical protein [Frankia sp. AgPm24]